MLGIVKFIGTVFGFGGGQTIANAAGGVVSYTALIAGGTYFVHHYNDMVPLTLPLWNVAIIGLVLWLAVEYYRRKALGGN